MNSLLFSMRCLIILQFINSLIYERINELRNKQAFLCNDLVLIHIEELMTFVTLSQFTLRSGTRTIPEFNHVYVLTIFKMPIC